MPMKYLILLIAITIQIQANAQFITGLKGKLFNHDSMLNNKAVMPMVFPSTVYAPNKFVARGAQIHYEFCTVNAKKEFTVLPTSFVYGFDFDGELYSERISNQYFVGQKDFDLDKIPELVIVLNDTDAEGNTDFQINILKYFPPASIDHVNRASNWELIGNFVINGAIFNNLSFDKQSIKSHITRLDFHEWTCVNNRFIYSGNASEPSVPREIVPVGRSAGSRPVWFTGTWKDENSTFTLNENGNFVLMFDDGKSLSGQWIINRFTLLFYNGKTILSQNQILNYSDKQFSFRDKKDPTIWNAKKIN